MFDVGFARKLELSEFKNMRYIKLNSDRMMVAVAKNHPLAEKDTIKLHELGDLPFIIVDYSRSHLSCFEAALARFGLESSDGILSLSKERPKKTSSTFAFELLGVKYTP